MSISIKNLSLNTLYLLLLIVLVIFSAEQLKAEVIYDKTHLFTPDHNQNLKIEGNGYKIDFSVTNAGVIENNMWVPVIWYIRVDIKSQNSGFFSPSYLFGEKEILNYKEEVKYIDKDNLKFTIKVVDFHKVYNNNERFKGNTYFFRDVSIQVKVERFE